MPELEPTEDTGGGFVVPPEAAPAVVSETVLTALTQLAAGPPLCLVCGAALRIERRTPDFGTHHTQVCDSCGYRLKVKD